MASPPEFVFSTSLSKKALKEKLKKFEPWGHNFEFTNGVTTSELEQRVPFSPFPWGKLQQLSKHLDFSQFQGGKLLDIGCNSGHHSVYFGNKYDMQVTGIDVSKRHIEVSSWFAELLNVKGEFLLESAETFSRPEEYDLLLHFGTLYHLPNPLLSLENSYKNLKDGGVIAIETQFYRSAEDKNICYFMYMQNNDPTNFWALSPHVLETYLHTLGFKHAKMVFETTPPSMEEGMSRGIFVAYK